MRVRRIGEQIRRPEWFAVGVDLVVVVLGIPLALQLDEWSERRDERRLEDIYLERLAEDLVIERAQMRDAESYAHNRIEAALFLDSLSGNLALASATPSRVPWASETATWRSLPQINSFVYRELQSTGRSFD